MRKRWQTLLMQIRRPETLTPVWGWPLAAGLIVIYWLMYLLSLLFTATLTNADIADPDAATLALSYLVAGGLSLILVMQYTGAAVRRFEGKKPPQLRDALGLAPSQTTPLWVVGFIGFALAVLLDTVGLIGGVSDASQPLPLRGLTLDDGVDFLMAVLVVLALRPLVEEILFRGMLYPVLLGRLTELQAIGLTALLSALLHYSLDPTYLWWGLLQPLGLGLVAGMARASTKSTWAAVIVHGMFGLFVTLRALLVG